MCGITGICNLNRNWQEQIHKMNEKIIHRGPDAEGIWYDENDDIAFGHRRLSIVDLSLNGNQPYESRSKRFIMVFNGEIYNYKAIGQRLIKEKYVQEFRSTSDTEVLVEAIEAYGVYDAIGLCKGMFAIAVYDRKDKKLYLLRDRMGEKPLYYGFIAEKFVFASDLASLKVVDGFNDKIDYKVLDLYFTYGCIPAPYSIYENIYKLEAGSVLEIGIPFTKNSIKVGKYWDLKEIAKKSENNLFTGTFDEAVNELEIYLEESIKDQMVADVPVGAFLSGGIDSSTIVSLMQKHSACNKVHTYTIGMKNSSFDEADVARKTANILGTDHTELYIDENDVLETIPRIAEYYSEPFADSSQIPTYLVSKLTKENVTVAISGDGGDELFCGYDYYVDNVPRWNKVKNVPQFVRAFDKQLLNIVYSKKSSNSRLAKKMRLLSSNSIGEFFANDRISDFGDANILLNKSNSYISKYESYENNFLKDDLSDVLLMGQEFILADDILTKVDRAAMAVSLETRIPMFDKDVIEFSWRLPTAYKYDGITKKKILRHVLKKYVPLDHIEGPKKGFSIPVNEWINKGNLLKWADEIMMDKTDVLDEAKVAILWNKYKTNSIWKPQIWYILMYKLWLNNNV